MRIPIRQSRFFKIPTVGAGQIKNSGPLGSVSQLATHYYCSVYNRTYICWSCGPSSYSREGSVLYYDHATDTFSASTKLGPQTMGEMDNHQLPSLIVDNDGYVYTAEERGHSSGIFIKRSNGPGDISSFSLVSTVGSSTATNSSDWTSAFAYPTWTKKTNGDLVLLVRDVYNHYSFFTVTNHGATVSAKTSICIVTPAGYTLPGGAQQRVNWVYGSTPFATTGTHYILMSLRTGLEATPTTQHMEKVYLVKTTDWITFSNISGSFTKNVVSAGEITRAQLDASCVWDGSSTDYNDWIWHETSAVGTSGEVYSIIRQIGGAYKLVYSSSGSIVKKSCPWTSEFLYDITAMLVHPNETTIDVWRGQTLSNGQNGILQYRTTDKGDNWNLHYTWAYNQSIYTNRPFISYNNQEMPTDKVRLILAEYVKNSSDSDVLAWKMYL